MKIITLQKIKKSVITVFILSSFIFLIFSALNSFVKADIYEKEARSSVFDSYNRYSKTALTLSNSTHFNKHTISAQSASNLSTQKSPKKTIKAKKKPATTSIPNRKSKSSNSLEIIAHCWKVKDVGGVFCYYIKQRKGSFYATLDGKGIKSERSCIIFNTKRKDVLFCEDYILEQTKSGKQSKLVFFYAKLCDDGTPKSCE